MHSPILCTIQYILDKYPEYRNHKFVVVSLDSVKQTESEEVYSKAKYMTIDSIKEYLINTGDNLSKYDSIEYDDDDCSECIDP